MTSTQGIAKRFGADRRAGIEAAIGAVNATMVDLLPPVRRAPAMP